MMKRILALALGLVLVATVAGAAHQGNIPTAPVAVSDVSGTVTLTATAQTIHFTNDGANPAIVRVFVTCESVAAILTTDTAARLIKPGESWGLDFAAREVSTGCTPTSTGFGYIGFAHVATAGLTTSIRWFSK